MATYPPRECGIATFTKDLLTSCQKLFDDNTIYRVAAMNLSALDTYEYPKEVVWQINQDSKLAHKTLASELNNNPNIKGTILEHEYGIFGGEEGENLLSFINVYKKPLIVTFHTVLPYPSDKMKSVTSIIINKAHKIVVLTKSSKKILETLYPQSIGKTVVIPHGVHNIEFTTTTRQKKNLKLENTIVLSTFGLLSRGKGIEYVIKALPPVVKQFPNIRYLIIGETHPVIRRAEGERYRLELIDLVTKLHLEKYVKFYDQYLDIEDLLNFLKATDIYISTSININQAVSGTLSYALGAGRASISTDFSQAKEIISAKTGALVPIQDSDAFTKEILNLLSNPQKLEAMHESAYEITRPMLWSNVAAQFYNVLEELQPTKMELSLPILNISHLRRMTDKHGLFQFASFAKPVKEFGYTLDDNARALVVVCLLLKTMPTAEMYSFLNIYLNFIEKCQTTENGFVNYLNHFDKKPSIQNSQEDIEESHARGLWGLAMVLTTDEISEELKIKARVLFLKAFQKATNFTHMRSKALMIKVISLVFNVFLDKKRQLLPLLVKYADSLVDSLKNNSSDSWYWFDNYLAYNNAILPESLFIAGQMTNNSEYTRQGIKSLNFLIDKTFTSSMYMPIGNEGWHEQNGTRSVFDQQPEDPTSMVLALFKAFETTQDIKYKKLAKICFTWFLGNNALNLFLYNEQSGGCFDGLHFDRVNLNQGAESLVSYLLARITISKMM